MWIRIKRKEKEFSVDPNTVEFDEFEHYVNLDRVEDVVIKEKKITFCFFGEGQEFTITPQTAKNFKEVKRLIEKGFAINLKET